jgi:hypothetical protein
VDAIVVRSVRSNPNNSYGAVYKKEGGYLTENAHDWRTAGALRRNKIHQAFNERPGTKHRGDRGSAGSA